MSFDIRLCNARNEIEVNVTCGFPRMRRRCSSAGSHFRGAEGCCPHTGHYRKQGGVEQVLD